MKNLISTFVLATSLTAALPALAREGTEGHGGGAIVCRDRSGSIMGDIGYTPELLDLWELRAITKQPVTTYLGSVGEYIERAMQRLAKWNPALHQEVVELLPVVKSAKEYIEPGVILAPPRDANAQFMREGCRLEGLASYDDEQDRLFVDAKIHRMMSALNQAALIVHEAVYKALRDHHDAADSVQARKIVGFLFAEDESLPAQAGIPATARHCAVDSGYDFYLYEQDGKAVFQFAQLNGMPVFGKTTAVTEINSILRKLIDRQNLKLKNHISPNDGDDEIMRKNSVRLKAQSAFDRKVLFIEPNLPSYYSANSEEKLVIVLTDHARKSADSERLLPYSISCEY